MRGLICTQCGATGLVQQNGQWICSYCGTRFSPNQNYWRPGNNPTAAFQSQIAVNSDVQQLLQKCRQDPANARRYANLVLDIDPTNREAMQYL